MKAHIIDWQGRATENTSNKSRIDEATSPAATLLRRPSYAQVHALVYLVEASIKGELLQVPRPNDGVDWVIKPPAESQLL